MKTFEEESIELRREAETFRDSAFPVTLNLAYQTKPNTSYVATSKGLSKRELFAGMAMQGLLDNSFGSSFFPSDFESRCFVLAKNSVQIADALLEALHKKSTED